MKLKLTNDPDIVAMMQAEIAAGERAVSTAIREAGTGLKTAWRGQITGAGLGARLARTIRSEQFPKATPSLNAAAVVWSKAPVTVGAHDTGPLIRSRNGFWLAIPTAAAGKSQRGGRISPGEWERRTGLRRVLVTVHRRENWDGALDRILSSLVMLRDHIPDIEIVFVAHANPMLRERVFAYLGQQSRIRIVGPLDYLSFISFLKSATLVLSDSGGVQEEAPVFGVPVLVLRESTERMEAVEAGVARLVGVDRDVVLQTASRLLLKEDERQQMVRAVSPFGDGHAARRIVDVLQSAPLSQHDPVQSRAAV